MDDLELQDEPLQIRLMDHDTYSANDAIGKVYLDLNPLLINSSKGKGSPIHCCLSLDFETIEILALLTNFSTVKE